MMEVYLLCMLLCQFAFSETIPERYRGLPFILFRNLASFVLDVSGGRIISY